MPPLQYPRAEPTVRDPAELIIRSPVVGWIFVVATALSLASAALLLPRVIGRPTPFGIGITLGCLAYAALCGWCWWQRRTGGRGILALGLFAWATITFIAAAAVPQKAGVNTVGFMVMPAFLFLITVLGHRRLSAGTLAYAALVFAGVTIHHAVNLPPDMRTADLMANAVIAAGLMLLFAALGDQVAHIVSNQVAQARRSAQDYRVLFERLPVGAFLHINREIIEANDAAHRLLGAHGDLTLIGRDLLTLVPESERAAIHTRLRQLSRLSAGEQLPMRDLFMQSLDGQEVPVSATVVSLDPAKGLTLVLLIDRSQQEKALRELQEPQRLVQALFRVSTHTMAVTDHGTGEYLLVNPAYARLVGREPEAMIGKTSIELGVMSAQMRSAFLSNLSADHASGSLTTPVIDVSGKVHDLRQTIVATEFDGRAVLVAVGRDVTEEQRVERELQVILAASPAAIYVVRHGRVTAASAQYERLLGLAPGSAVGRSYDEDIGGPQSMAAIIKRWNARIAAGGIVRYEHEVFRKDGSTFPGLLTGRLIKPGARDGFGMVWVIEDMTERREREANLARAKSDAEAASRAKTGFLATMSHEIRTPLNGILGLIDLAGDPQLDEASRRAYFRMMSDSARALMEIVSDVLDVSRIESGQLQLEPRAFDLSAWLVSLERSFHALAEAKGLLLQVQAPPEVLGWVQGDPGRLRQILANYLSNALKFTLSGRITIGLSRPSAQRLRLEVSDTGLGVPAEAVPRLFQPFSQAAGAFGEGRSSGLGLAICRQLAELMGGTTGVSTEPGVGSCFWAEVNLPPVPAPAAGSEPAGKTIRLDGLHLLVVDDNRINLVVARRLLERAGARVQVADGGQDALQAIDAAHATGDAFDLVVMDVQMPGMDGLQALAEIRQRPHGRHVPVIAASAAVTTEEVDLTRAAGFDGFVSKPLEVGTLLRAVAERAVAQGRDLQF